MPRRRVPRSAAAALVAVLAAPLAACDQYAVAADPATDASPAATPELTPIPEQSVIDPCAVGVIASGAAAEPIRDASGGCLDVDRAILLRCDPAGPPALVLDGGDRVFLGEAFAVATPSRPAGLVEIGTTTAGRVWTSASDPRRLYVESSGVWSRWLRLAAPTDLDQPPTVLLIGDSILDGAREAVVEALPGWEVTVDAEVGRASVTATGIAEALADPLPDVVVIQIGTNDHDPVGFADRADRILAAVRDADLAVWVTTSTPRPESAGINDAILASARGTPQTAVADWEAFVRADQLNSDGVHPAPGNEHLLAELLAPLLRQWDGAVRDGMLGCVSATS